MAKLCHHGINAGARTIYQNSIFDWKFTLFLILALLSLTLAENMVDFVCLLVPQENNLMCASQMFPYIGLRTYRCLILPISNRAEILWIFTGSSFSAKFLVNTSWNPITYHWTWRYLSWYLKGNLKIRFYF